MSDAMGSNNEPQFSLLSFKKCPRDWRVEHIASTPEYPRSNRLAEKAVQTVKCVLAKAKIDSQDA